MKMILAIPVVLAKTLADVLFGTDEITESMRAQRNKAQILLLMGRSH